jgi:hypothetical protein
VLYLGALALASSGVDAAIISLDRMQCSAVPDGTWLPSSCFPRACTLGCILSALCGWGLVGFALFDLSSLCPLAQAAEIPTSRKGREKWGTQVSVGVKSNVNVKGNGQESPFHMGGGDAEGQQQVPHRAFGPVRNDKV